MSASVLISNLHSPPVLAFAAGVAAIGFRSDLKIPEQIYQGLAIYLLIAIGFKGGIALSDTNLSSISMPTAATILIGASVSIATLYFTKVFIFKDWTNAGALAAHYGSVSAVTFIACITFLETKSIPYEGFMTAMMAIMEIPAIVIGLALAKYHSKEKDSKLKAILMETLTGKSVFLLATGLIIGASAGPIGAEKAAPFLIQPFYGVLIIFLLEMGLTAGRSMKNFGNLRGKLIAFAIVAPLVNGFIGVIIGKFIGLSIGGSTLLGTLAASASYIAAPAAVRIALPQANAGYYVFTSLGVTFPFNLIIGIPIYYYIASSF
ncbi:sodium-dependent bicarbonate transport family permease [Puniceicoccaceae bacterium K14]|nr:sodium-dependent bicarbonate transport family permease [Puniceicoccaceae bacterium K14]